MACLEILPLDMIRNEMVNVRVNINVNSNRFHKNNYILLINLQFAKNIFYDFILVKLEIFSTIF